MTLYAYWEKEIDTVTFDGNCDLGNYPFQTVDYETLLSEPSPQSSIAGGRFSGWFISPEGGVRWDFTIGVSSDVILYAQWGIPFARALEQVKETSARKQDIKIVGPLNKENLSQLAIEIKVKTSSEFCLDLSGVTGLTEVGDYCFDKCTNLKDIRLPDTVEIIGNYAFRETGIDKIYFPKSLKKLGDAVYEECLSLTRVEIPGHIEQIGANLFYSCTGILSATLPEGMYEIPKTMFQYCKALMTVNSPESVRIIRTSAFANCKYVTSFVLPDSLLYIERSAFSNCAFESIAVPDAAYEIDEFSFNDNENLKTVRLGSCLLKIGEGAFCNCPQLTRVTVDAAYPPKLGYKNYFPFDKDNENLFFFVPAEALSRYQTGYRWTYDNIKDNDLD